MKMLNNGLGADGFAISRTPIPSPRSTKMEEGDRRYAARPPERPVHPDHHAEDGAVAEHVDGADDEKAIKTGASLSPTQNVWSLSKHDGSETQTQDTTPTTACDL